MDHSSTSPALPGHHHVFLGAKHEHNERKTWAVIWLCCVMMLAEIVGGSLFGSLALVADGLHMSTHAGALLIAALAYTYSRRHAHDPRFVFGTGKLGDLAGFTSAIILAMISLLIGYEAVVRLMSPVQINFHEAIPIAIVGLLVNVASAWLLSGDHHGHSHGHGHTHDCEHDGHEQESHRVETAYGEVRLDVFENGVPPRFRIHSQKKIPRQSTTIETLRLDGRRHTFSFLDRGTYLESVEEIPEPHEFKVFLRIDGIEYAVDFVEHSHDHHHADHHHHADAHQDNNMRAAFVHVIADAAVSVLTIAGLVLAAHFGWIWMDPLAGVVGALVIANWSFSLLRDTGAILLDMNPGSRMKEEVRKSIESNDDQLADLHLWRLGPGHLGAIISVITSESRDIAFYRARLARFSWLSHVTIEIQHKDSLELIS